MEDDILHYPQQTHVMRSVPKTAFYEGLDMEAKMRQHFVSNISSFTWLYKLAPSTLNVADGDKVHEITVFRVAMKEMDYPTTLFTFIDKNMPRYVVFVLQYNERYQLLLNYKEPNRNNGNTYVIVKTFATDWLTAEELRLPIEGLNMDSLYESFAGTISGLGTKNSDDTLSAIALQTAIQQKSAQVNTLKKKIQRECQLNKQMTLNANLRQLIKEVDELKERLHALIEKAALS